MNKKLFPILLVLVGITLLIIAAIYFIEPAKSLPQFFPGYDNTIAKHHYKHGIGAVMLALGAFVLAWFQSGSQKKKNIETATPNTTQ